MKKEVLFVLLDDFADWEGAFLAPALAQGITREGGGTDYIPRTFCPSKTSVRSLGGMTVTVDYTTANVPEDFAALILVGGMQWQSDDAEAVVPLVAKALSRGRLVGAICNATGFLAAHGFLNDVRHTGNTLDVLRQWGGERYTGQDRFEEQQAVRDGNIVTANGTAGLEFMRECLAGLQVGTPEGIDAYYAFNKHGFYGQ